MALRSIACSFSEGNLLLIPLVVDIYFVTALSTCGFSPYLLLAVIRERSFSAKFCDK
jgi:hypothetical protein